MIEAECELQWQFHLFFVDFHILFLLFYLPLILALCWFVLISSAGQERYRAITTAYYRGALGAMLVYDATKSSTFDNIPRWLRELKDHANRDIVLIQIGNKVDLCSDSNRQVTEDMAKQMATELDIPYIETSAKTGMNVDKAFTSVIERIYQNAQLSKQTNNAASKSPASPTGAAQNSAAAASPTPNNIVTLGSSSTQPAAAAGGSCC